MLDKKVKVFPLDGLLPRSPTRRIQRVLITTDMVGGVWHFTLELARGLEAFGVQPLIAVLGEATPDVLEEVAELGLTRLFLLDSRLEWMQDPWQDVKRSGRWLLSLENALKPCIVHLNSYAHAVEPFRAPVLVVGHSCVYSWYQAIKSRAPSARWRAYRKAVQRGLRAADGVTAPTRTMLNSLKDFYGPFQALPPIPNGRNPNDFPPAEKEPFIFGAGRLWDKAKNMSALAGIAARLPWPVVLAGEACHPEGGRVELSNVELLGCQSMRQMQDWFARASIYALPALYEPFGLTVLEAGLSGCALVLGDIGSLRENWDGAALFVPPRQPELLLRMLSRLVTNSSLRKEYARRARDRASKLTALRMTIGYMRLYRHLLAQRPLESLGMPAPAISAADGFLP